MCNQCIQSYSIFDIVWAWTNLHATVQHVVLIGKLKESMNKHHVLITNGNLHRELPLQQVSGICPCRDKGLCNTKWQESGTQKKRPARKKINNQIVTGCGDLSTTGRAPDTAVSQKIADRYCCWIETWTFLVRVSYGNWAFQNTEYLIIILQPWGGIHVVFIVWIIGAHEVIPDMEAWSHIIIYLGVDCHLFRNVL